MSQMRRQKYLGHKEKKNPNVYAETEESLLGKKKVWQWCKTVDKRKKLVAYHPFIFLPLTQCKAHSCKGRLLLVRQVPPAGKNPHHRHFSATNFFFIDPRWFSDIFHVVILQGYENGAIRECTLNTNVSRRTCLTVETRNRDTCFSPLKESSKRCTEGWDASSVLNF